MIDVTRHNMRNLVRSAYDLSRPQGLGFLHYKQGSLSDVEIDEILGESDERYAVRMDYVNGRSCKLTVRRIGDKLYVHDEWHDHSSEQLRELLKRSEA